jgi:hypothetical protein
MPDTLSRPPRASRRRGWVWWVLVLVGLAGAGYASWWFFWWFFPIYKKQSTQPNSVAFLAVAGFVVAVAAFVAAAVQAVLAGLQLRQGSHPVSAEPPAPRKSLPALWTLPRFLGAPPKMPDRRRLVSRADLSQKVAEALRAGGGPVALTGVGGAGKSTLAAGACLDRRVRRRFRGGVTWLEAGPRQDLVALLGDLGRRLGLPTSESGFTTVAQGRDTIAAVLVGKRVLVAVDNVWERGPVDALTGLAPGCMVLFTTRSPGLATTFSGVTQIPVDKLTHEQALELLGHWVGLAPAELPDAARALCTRVGNLPLGVAMAGAMVARGRSFTDVLVLIEQGLDRVHAELDPEYQYRDLLAAIEAGISDLPQPTQHRMHSWRCSPVCHL